MIENRQIIENDFLNEKYTKIKHSSGLTIFLINKDLSTSYAIFATNFGSMDNKFVTNGKSITLPDGVAHFLEHKMFEEPDGSDAFERFSQYGANANAYTTFDKTCYLFSCTDHLYENLEILLDFVSTPVFESASIEKEKGIITQEIAMDDDDPNRCVFNKMLEAMYHNSPIAIDVAGTVDSISKIDTETLYLAYNTFYSLNNMALCLCGHFEEDKVLEICDRVLSKKEIAFYEPIVFEEPREIKTREIISKMQIAQPIYSFGFKGSQCNDQKEMMRKSTSLSISTKAIFGRSSDFFEKNYSSGIINKSFSVSNYAIRDHLFGVVDGTAKDPYKVYEEVLKEIEKTKENGIPIDDFNRAKKSLYSNVVMSFDSTEEIANNFISFAFEEQDFFDYIETIISINIEEAYNDFIELYNDKNAVLSIILPK